MIRKFLLLLGVLIVMMCTAPAPSEAQPAPPPPGGGGGSEVIPPPPPPVIPPPPPVIPPTIPTTPTFTIGPSITPMVAPTPQAAATQINLPEFHSSTILPTDTLPFKVNGPLQVRLSQGQGMVTNFSVLLDEKSMLLVVAEKTEYTAETPMESPRVVTSVAERQDTSPEAIAKQEVEQKQLQEQLLMNNFDNELASDKSVDQAANNATAQPADDAVAGTVEQPATQQPKRTMMQKIKKFFQSIGGAKAKPADTQKPQEPTSKAKAKTIEFKTKKQATLPAPTSTLELAKGCMLVKGHQPVMVKVAGNEVYVQHDATALIMTDGKQLKVITLNNHRGKSVYVVFNDKRHRMEIPLQQLWKFEGDKLARLHNIITVEANDKDPRQPKIQQWEADRMLLNQILVQHPLVYSMAKHKSPYANHKCIRSFQKTIAAYAVVNAQKRRAMGVPMTVPPAPGMYTIWDHFFVK